MSADGVLLGASKNVSHIVADIQLLVMKPSRSGGRLVSREKGIVALLEEADFIGGKEEERQVCIVWSKFWQWSEGR